MTAEDKTGRDPLEERDPIEVLASEFIERQRKGEHPDLSEYVAKHPELADEIRELFPTITSMERLKIRREQTTDGCASLGPVKLERLGDFRIIREIGRGGMGVVFEAEQESLERRVAVKVLPGNTILDPEQVKRFEREARFAAGLHHTNIVPVIGVGEHSGFHYIVMQYIRGVGLDKVINSLMHRDRFVASPSGRTEESKSEIDAANGSELKAVIDRLLSGKDHGKGKPRSAAGSESRYFESVARIGLQAAEALHYGHSQGTLHRDIKPANLLLDTRGVVWITDFGVAKAIQSEGATQTAEVTGTLRYVAPERFQGKTDARSDTYSLGLTLYEMLTLQWAYNATDHHSLTMQIVNHDLAAPRRINPRIPRDLETIVQKATAREPDRRYPTAEEFAADLNRFLEDRPIEARRITPVERLWFWCRRNPVVAGLAAAVLVLLTLVAAVAGIGYIQTKDANLRVTNALDGEKEQRQKAETTAGLALDVLDKIYTQFAPTRFDGNLNLTVEGSDGTEIEIPVQPTLSKETAALLDSLLVFYDRLAEQGGDDTKLWEKRANANHRVGTIEHYLGQFEQAEAAYERALEIYEDLEGRNPRTAGFESSTAKIHNELGLLYRTFSRPEDGFAAHLKALAILDESAAQRSPSREARYELARTFYYLGSVTWRDIGPAPPGPPDGPPRAKPGRQSPGQDRLRPPPDRERPPPRHRGRPGEAGDRTPVGLGRPPEGERLEKERYLEKAIAILTDLTAESASDPACRHLLGLCYRDRFPGMPLELGLEEIKKAAQILEDLVDEFPDAVDFRFDLAETYAIWDARHLPIDLFATAERDFAKALKILEALVVEHPHVPSYLMSRIQVHHKMADILRRTDRIALAERHLETALNYQRSLARRFPDNSSYTLWTAVIQNSFARLLRDLDRLTEARELLEDSIDILLPLLEVEPLLNQIRGLLFESHMETGHLLRRMGDDESARAMFDKAHQYRRDR